MTIPPSPFRVAGTATTRPDGTRTPPGAGSQPRKVVWPVRAGTVPPLVHAFTRRTESVPGIESLLALGPPVNNLTNFLNVLLMVFIVWSAVNLADYFVVQHGHYDVAAFFDPAGGPYGKVRWSGVIAALAGLVAEWPFVAQSDYIGPLVARLGGADISWVVGWLVAAGVYLGLELHARRTSRRRPPAPVFTGRP